MRPLLLAAAVLAGCNAQPTLQESTLKEQAALVRSGQSDRILIEHTVLTDDDLQELASLPTLKELLLDSNHSRFTSAGIRRLAALRDLEHLRIRGAGIDDEALKQLARLEGLQILNLPQATFGDAALAELKRLPNLVQFRFHSPHVTDAGMQTLGELPAIKRLHLINVPITDAGLAVLAKIDQLESLYIDGGQFSDEAVQDLFRKRPRLHVHFNQSHHDLDPHQHSH
jgi:hypothetical protein